MKREAADQGRVIFTVGHSNHELERFVELLDARGVKLLVDVRSQPYSGYTPHFNRRELEVSLPARGIDYEFLGQALGGMPEDAEFYDQHGHVMYSRIAESPAFQDGIAALTERIGRVRAALMCGEEDPRNCHRRLLIGRVLMENGVSVLHILADGTVKSEEELRREEADQDRQLSLFPAEENQEWKSTRSVSPKKAPKNFSKR